MRSSLNPEQAAAVEHVTSSALILAGAGSGKTRVLLEKIFHLVSTQRYQPEQILAITFTQQAANELKQRLLRLSKRHNVELKPVCIGTFHAIALALLRRHRATLGTQSRLLLCAEADKRHIIQTLLGQAEGNRIGLDAQEQLSAQIAFWKNYGIDPKQAAEQASAPQRFAAQLYGAYQAHLQRFGWVDFEDLIQLAVKKLQTDPVCLREEQERYHYFLIDEFQDTNLMQWALIKTLVGSRLFTAVGDDDQAIYGWRGAAPELLNEVIDAYPNLKVIKLEKSYRCSRAILSIANEVIANNPHLFEKTLYSDRSGGKVSLVLLPDAEAEADWIAEAIEKEWLGARTRKIAILYRSHQQAQHLKAALKEKKLECLVIGEEELLNKVEPRLMMDYWLILSDLDSDANLLRVINTPKRGIGGATLQRLGEWAQSHQKSYWESLNAFGFLSELKNSEREAVERFTQWVVEQQRKIWMLERDPSPGWANYLRTIIQELELDAYFSQGVSEKFLFVRRQRLQKICTLLLSKLKYSKTPLCPGGEFTLALNKLQALANDSNDLLSGAEPPVLLMTLHASKGLEFDSVYLCGLEQGILPHRSAITEQAIQEERRLFYVGITRSRAQLTLTYATTRNRQGKTQPTEPSVFLKEISGTKLELLKILPETLQKARMGIAQKYLSQLRQALQKSTAPPCPQSETSLNA